MSMSPTQLPPAVIKPLVSVSGRPIYYIPMQGFNSVVGVQRQTEALEVARLQAKRDEAFVESTRAPGADSFYGAYPGETEVGSPCCPEVYAGAVLTMKS